MAQRTTMADVAREAGVSLMTVSRVVNHKEGISDDTRRRVQAIINRLGYRPSHIARGLVTARTGTIGLVVPDNANPFFSELARGIEQIAYTEGYNVFLCNTEEDTERELAVLQSLEEKRVDGIILCSSRLDEETLALALAPHTAIVLVNRTSHQRETGSVTVADHQGGLCATRHLLAHGHRHIGLLAGPSRSYSGQHRAAGYRSALAEAGIAPNADYERHCMATVSAGREAALNLLQAQSELTALFCFNDLTAVGALQACAQLGFEVPEDIAIVGFDDIPLASLVTPSLTTCHIPMEIMGRHAMSLLLDHIENCDEGCQDIEVQSNLVVRASAP